jgi:hypothetical protein
MASFVWVDRYVLMPADGLAPSGYDALSPSEAPCALRHVSSAPGAAASIYKLWLALGAGPVGSRAVPPSQRDRSRAVQWAVEQLGERGALALCRAELTPCGELPELFGIEPPRMPALPRTDERHWIQFDLQDQLGEPIAAVPYVIQRGEEAVAQGTLDRFGTVYLDAIEPGSYRFGIASAKAPPEEKDFLALELIDDQGDPVAGARYRVTDSAKQVHEGVLNASGRALVDGIAPGSCEIAWPEWPEDATSEV